ncbi:nucleoid-associated protein [Halosquirtibacter xylanolyticus]|uniref:nucleoid-associated protein n=1 Tax=Halosquirtibacter xylanolyticus TaxID=3374599 RepID=UPI00374855C0|nr:nucleoid-associated protein [Prolixibacteraceae bacterium]
MQITKETYFKHLIVHKIGNKHKNEALKLSDECSPIQAEFAETLLRFFMSPFSTDEAYHFSKEISTEQRLCGIINEIFHDQDNFTRNSQDIAQYLYDICNHANIKNGELYVTYIENILLEDQVVSAVGLFKSEHKETYLRLEETAHGIKLNKEEGINPQKMDKGCVIINTEKEDGYRMFLIDKVKKNDTAKFWKETFLNATLVCDDKGLTSQYLELTRNFINDVCHAQNEVQPVEQLEIITDTMDYFSNTDSFDKKEFKDKVLKSHPDKKVLFDEYQKAWQDDNKLKLKDKFEITNNAVEKAKQRFKHVLKLDKNFHIYVHGSQKLIERGYDKKKEKYYYKLYFDQEL